jgi:protoporphyrinogen IX oxidase
MYLWLKAFHIIAMVAWIGGMLNLALLLSAYSKPTNEASQFDPRLIASALRWDRLVTAPAMLVVWALGLTMASQAGWFSSRWLMMKLILVVALSGLHGVQSGALRRRSWDDGRVISAPLRHSAALTLLAVSLAVVLVVTKLI